MADEQPGQFGVQLSGGLRVDRLPIGWAAGHWWMGFIFSGVDFRAGRRPRGDGMWDELPDLLRLDGDAGRITLPPTAAGDGGFGANHFWVQYQFQDDLRQLEVSYLDDGSAVASESLHLG